MRPRLALVSTDIRRDLLEPLKHFTQFDLIHLYRRASYGDLAPEDMPAGLEQYGSPRDLYRRLLRARPDLIQGVEPFSLARQPDLWACYLAARRTGARLLAVTLENRPLEYKFGSGAAFALRRALKTYFSRACLVIALNRGARQNVLRCGVYPQKVKRLMWGTWGVNVDEFSPALEAESRADATVLFAGRLTPEKGVLVLLDAFARLRTRLPARLVIAGDGPARQAVAGRAAEIGGVELVGTIKNREMPDLLRSAAVLVMPSLTTRKWEEQVGMVGLQAMACGVPVVATFSGAIPEYIPDGEGGLLVPENDAAALAMALERVLGDGALRAQLARGARAYACAHYDAARNIKQAERVVKEHCLARGV